MYLGSRKFNHPGGRIDVVLTANKGWVVISITDTGCGIAPEEHLRIFERSYRSSSTQESAVPGTGLGLHFARHIAEAHGGRIEVNSVAGEGSTFRVLLPLVPGRATASSFPAASESQKAIVN